MKVKPVSVKTIVLGRTGKSVIRTPLAVGSATSCCSQPSEGSSSLSEADSEVHVNDQDVPVFSSDEFQQSAAQFVVPFLFRRQNYWIKRS